MADAQSVPLGIVAARTDGHALEGNAKLPPDLCEEPLSRGLSVACVGIAQCGRTGMLPGRNACERARVGISPRSLAGKPEGPGAVAASNLCLFGVIAANPVIQLTRADGRACSLAGATGDGTVEAYPNDRCQQSTSVSWRRKPLH